MEPTRSLFVRFTGTRRAPWVPLAQLPTPVEQLGLTAERLDAAGVWIKRDDLTGERYGGNKVRKLEFLLGEACALGASDVITFGAAGSNHALATAIYGESAGLTVHSMLTPQPNAAYVGRNLLASTAVGADLHYLADRERALRVGGELAARLACDGGGAPYVIPLGGTSPLSTLGFVNAGLELADQVSAGLLPEPDLVFVALGSMGTAAGLMIGLRAAGLSTRVVPVAVLRTDERVEADLAELLEATGALLREYDDTFPHLEWRASDLRITREFLGEGYACKTPAGLEAIEMMRGVAGIELETTYTGKAFAALLAASRAGELAGRNVLFWDTFNSREMDGLIAAGDADRLEPSLRPYLGSIR